MYLSMTNQIKTNYKCNLNDLIEIYDSRTRNTRCITAEEMDLDIYYEDSDVVSCE